MSNSVPGADLLRRPYQPRAAGGALYIRPLYFGSGPNLILAPPSEVSYKLKQGFLPQR